MLRLAIFFLSLALLAAALGFTGIGGEYVNLAKVSFLALLVLFILSATASALRGRTS